MYRLIFLIVGSFLGNQLFAQPAANRSENQTALVNTENIKNKFFNIVYSGDSPAQKLDIYLPNTGIGPFPVIVAIHGGAFKMGDKTDPQVNAALTGLERGYAVVSINYRLSSEAVFPAQIQDVKAAIRWVRANAKTYKLNPDKLAAWGNSAGGHLSAMAGTTGDVSDFDENGLVNGGQSSEVQAVVDWFGPIQFDQMDLQFKVSKKGLPNHDEANSPESELIGKPITQALDLVKAACPASFISKEDPPFFIQHGTNDNLVPSEQSKNFYMELVKTLGQDKVILELLPGVGHGGPQFETPENLNKVFAFLDKYLKN